MTTLLSILTPHCLPPALLLLLLLLPPDHRVRGQEEASGEKLKAIDLWGRKSIQTRTQTGQNACVFKIIIIIIIIRIKRARRIQRARNCIYGIGGKGRKERNKIRTHKYICNEGHEREVTRSEAKPAFWVRRLLQI